MKKIILRLFLIGILLFGLYAVYRTYAQYKEKQRRAAFYENLVDTASPNVNVLRDSISIAYQNKKRTIQVYLPPNYDRESSLRFPVIYFLDGQAAFNDLEAQGPEWQIDEVIDEAANNSEATAIVIAINSAEDRDAEYTPFVNEDNPNAHGAEFAKWLVTDLKDWVDTNYPTKTDAASTTIGGISRSGMMAYYMLMAHPDVIGNALVQSPAMWVDYDRLIAMELSEDQLRDKKIMLSVGGMESSYMKRHAKGVNEKFKAQGLTERQLRFETIPKEGHWNVAWRKSFAIAYPWLINK